jgi:hypothetical protein
MFYYSCANRSSQFATPVCPNYCEIPESCWGLAEYAFKVILNFSADSIKVNSVLKCYCIGKSAFLSHLPQWCTSSRVLAKP